MLHPSHLFLYFKNASRFLEFEFGSGPALIFDKIQYDFWHGKQIEADQNIGNELNFVQYSKYGFAF